MREREGARHLEGFVQIDDPYLGGQRNRGQAGCGLESGRPFVISAQTDAADHPGCAVIESVEGFTTAALAEWAQRRLHVDAEVFGAGLAAFRPMVPLNHAHTVIEAGGGRKATEAGGARRVTIVPSNLKRALDGTYHAFRFFKYAHRYLAEAAWRFDPRLRLVALVPRLLVAVARCPIWPGRMLRDLRVFAS